MAGWLEGQPVGDNASEAQWLARQVEEGGCDRALEHRGHAAGQARQPLRFTGVVADGLALEPAGHALDGAVQGLRPGTFGMQAAQAMR
jgi:hypothetical protein